MVEWVVGLLCAVLVAGLVAFLGYQALFGTSGPPDLNVRVERIHVLGGQSRVAVAIENRGDEAASTVTVEARASDASGTAFAKQVEFDYVAAHAVRRGTFVVSGEISAADVVLEIGGYAEP